MAIVVAVNFMGFFLECRCKRLSTLSARLSLRLSTRAYDILCSNNLHEQKLHALVDESMILFFTANYNCFMCL